MSQYASGADAAKHWSLGVDSGALLPASAVTRPLFASAAPPLSYRNGAAAAAAFAAGYRHQHVHPATNGSGVYHQQQQQQHQQQSFAQHQQNQQLLQQQLYHQASGHWHGGVRLPVAPRLSARGEQLSPIGVAGAASWEPPVQRQNLAYLPTSLPHTSQHQLRSGWFSPPPHRIPTPKLPHPALLSPTHQVAIAQQRMSAERPGALAEAQSGANRSLLTVANSAALVSSSVDGAARPRRQSFSEVGGSAHTSLQSAVAALVTPLDSAATDGWPLSTPPSAERQVKVESDVAAAAQRSAADSSYLSADAAVKSSAAEHISVPPPVYQQISPVPGGRGERDIRADNAITTTQGMDAQDIQGSAQSAHSTSGNFELIQSSCDSSSSASALHPWAPSERSLSGSDRAPTGVDGPSETQEPMDVGGDGDRPTFGGSVDRLLVDESPQYTNTDLAMSVASSEAVSTTTTAAGCSDPLAQITEANRAAALRLEERIRIETLGGDSRQQTAAHGGIISPPVTRPPGLGPPPSQPHSSPMGSYASGSGQTVYQCQVCGFSTTSKFHFNSHMNTHTDHQCSMCDYTSRTEGRLKKHMKEFHSREDQEKAGIVLADALNESDSLDAAPISMVTVKPIDEPPSSALEQMQAMARSHSDSLQLPTTSAALAESAAAAEARRMSVGSSGKPKNYRCKQCGHVSTSKDESWAHARTHIPLEKQLTCPKCEFVTEYKHHLEYHLRNHFGSKPFQCKKCNYSCVNKSMLNSHMKSHSNFYQYRCSDCTYATKYCHSLKLHLRKYGHRPSTIVQADGTVLDPTQIDIYGTRRGPKRKDSPTPPPPPQMNAMAGYGQMAQMTRLPTVGDAAAFGGAAQLPLILQCQQLEAAIGLQRMASLGGVRLPAIPSTTAALQQHVQQQLAGDPSTSYSSAAGESDYMLSCGTCGYRAASREDLLKHNLHHMVERQPSLVGLYGTAAAASSSSMAALMPDDDDNTDGKTTAGGSTEEQMSVENSPVTGEGSSQTSSGSPASAKASGDESSGDKTVGRSSRRKGKAFKLDQISQRLQGRKASPTHSGSSGQEDHESIEVSHQIGAAEEQQTQEVVETGPTGAPVLIRREPPSMLPRAYEKAAAEAQSSAAVTAAQAAYAAALSAALHTRADSAEGSASRSTSGGGAAAEAAWRFVCAHCRIAFEDEVMYHIHMGYHGYDNPFHCNRCGHVSHDRVSHNLHLLQAKHD